MKKYFVIAAISLVISVSNFLACKQKIVPEKAIAQALIVQVDSFCNLCKLLQIKAAEKTPEEKQLQQIFLKARLAYKSFEWAAEYFEPATSRFVNGPPVEEVELSGQVFQPAGLQVVESFLFPVYNTDKKDELIQQAEKLQQQCFKYRRHFAQIDILNWQVFDAIKLEIFRIETLGITGFDNPLTLKSMQESAVALNSVKKILPYYKIDEQKKLCVQFNAANKYLISHTDFNSFHRAEFIVAYCNPITSSIANAEKKLNIKAATYNRLLNQDAKTLFDKDAFNVNAYAPDRYSFTSDEKIALGKKLFSDPILSGNGTRSCQSCHQPQKAFTDGLDKNTIINNTEKLNRNTPTLINAALQPFLFYDLRVKNLEDQSATVIQNAAEMHGSLSLSVQKLWADSVYKKMFTKAFPTNGRTGIDTAEVMNAIGSFVRSLVALNSRFDEYMQGNKNALNEEEVNGFNLFMGKAKCATCHYMPLFNGTFPPRYMKTEAEVLGVPQSTKEEKVDDDLGAYNVIKLDALKHAFKTPTVRNAARTAPYMHNGVYTSLKQVVDFYNKGGGAGLGFKLSNQTLSSDKLYLTDEECNTLVAFIKSLNSL